MRPMLLRALTSSFALLTVLGSGRLYAVDAASYFDSARYDAMKREFLNIDPDHVFPIGIKDMTSDELSAFMGHVEGAFTPFKMEEKTGGSNANNLQDIWGATHRCLNSYGDAAVCWLASGGTEGVKSGPTCGTTVNSDYETAVMNPDRYCQKPNTPWSGFRFWMGVNSRTDWIKDHFKGAASSPLNRVCAELQFPDAGSLRLGYEGSSDIVANPELRTLVNPSSDVDHLQDIMLDIGTYTGVVSSNDGSTRNEENGGAYHEGGAHFYYKPTSYNRPPDSRVYALDERTVVACFAEFPSGTRSGMRPNSVFNPLMSLGVADDQGMTLAPSFINYLTRFYFDIEINQRSIANYPFNIAINKMWVMYEENDIVAATKSGGTLGLDMIMTGDTAFHPFTVHNFADEAREYSVRLNAGGARQEIKPLAAAKVYEDVNDNGLLDGDEWINEIVPGAKLTFEPNISRSFIIAHTPDFGNGAYSKEAWGRRFSTASVAFVQEGRLRATGFHVRTWQGTPEQIRNKDDWFADTRYGSASSEWSAHHSLNLGHEPDTNPNLIRNSPDFRKLRPVESAHAVCRVRN